MSHAHPVPEASVAPWPKQEAPHSPVATDTEAKPAGTTEKAGEAEKKGGVELSKAQMLGAGLAVGSAAIAAALLYWGKSQRKS